MLLYLVAVVSACVVLMFWRARASKGVPHLSRFSRRGSGRCPFLAIEHFRYPEGQVPRFPENARKRPYNKRLEGFAPLIPPESFAN